MAKAYHVRRGARSLLAKLAARTAAQKKQYETTQRESPTRKRSATSALNKPEKHHKSASANCAVCLGTRSTPHIPSVRKPAERNGAQNTQ